MSRNKTPKQLFQPPPSELVEMEELLQPLCNAELPPEQRARVEERIRRTADDPARIARSEALPADHPLRVAAAAVTRALDAVTKGPVAPEALALPEVSRTSPLAPWKMMVRAIAAFYAYDDAACERYLSAVDPVSPAFRVSPALRGMMGQRGKQTPETVRLMRSVDNGSVMLRTALTALDGAWENGSPTYLESLIARAVKVCAQVKPELLVALKQQISVRAMLAELRADRVTAALNGPSLKNAAFWRLLARAHEEARKSPLDVPMACAAWEEFRKHAIHEKWFPPNGPEVSALYLHMVDLWRRIADEDVESVIHSFSLRFPGQSEYYKGQPPEILELAAVPGYEDLYFVSSYALLERACEADPCAENFERWLKLADESDRGDEVATRWSAALPLDIRPLLHLMRSAENKSAFKKAFKLMEQAERVDGLNPEVRKSRFRLLISMVVRHLRLKKLHLADPELCQLEALPQAQQGDRPALLAGLRATFWILRGAPLETVGSRLKLEELLGETAAGFLLFNLARVCDLPATLTPECRFAPPMADAVGRVCALGEDARLIILIPPPVVQQLKRELSGKAPVPDNPGLAALGEVALFGEERELAYAVSGAGLRLPQERWAEFLFLRARALPESEEERQSLCAAAASELARRQRNLDLLRRIGEWREEERISFDRSQTEVVMTSGQVDDLVKREQSKQSYPARRRYARNDAAYCDCPECRAQRKAATPSLEDMIDGMPAELARMLEELGPEALEQALEQILRGALPKRGRRGRRTVDSGDIPF